jgi:hypothetical protein
MNDESVDCDNGSIHINLPINFMLETIYLALLDLNGIKIIVIIIIIKSFFLIIPCKFWIFKKEQIGTSKQITQKIIEWFPQFEPDKTKLNIIIEFILVRNK